MGEGSAPSTPNPPGLRLYPFIREPRKRVVVLIVPRTCEILCDFTRFHENERFHESVTSRLFTLSKQSRKAINHHENEKKGHEQKVL